MRSIFGRINLNGDKINQSALKLSLDQFSSPSKIKENTTIQESLGFVYVDFHSIKEELFHAKSSSFILLSDSTIYNKLEIARDLNLKEKEPNNDLIILKAYEEWGNKCIDHLIGDFTFAIWDIKKEELFCARDHLGVKPFYYYFDNDTFIFSSDISSILKQNNLQLSLDHQYIADTISIIKSENFRTTYKEIKRLLPAHTLTLKNNQLELNQYWKLNEQKKIQGRDVDIIAEFKNILTEAVRCRVDNQKTIGTELSGGIDSSTVSAIASSSVQVKSFSHVLPDNLLGKIYPFKDEREFIKLLADFCHIKERFAINSNESLIEVIEENVEDFKSLTQQNFGIFSDQLYHNAKQQNVSVLLSGFGGDEAVTSQANGYLKELATNKNWKELKKDLKNQKRKNIQFLKSFVKLYLKSQIHLLTKISLKKTWWAHKFKNLAINKKFLEKLKVKERYYSFFSKSDLNSLQKRLIERIIHPHVSQRLEYCSLIARKYGIEYRYPLLDIRLIEYYLSVPTRLKARNGIGRYLVRRAVEGIIPEKIQWRNDKSGATIPTVFMRMLNDERYISHIIQRAKSNNLVKQYIEVGKLEQWFHKLRRSPVKKQKYINPGAFFNYLKLILFIEKNPSLFK